MDLHRAQGSEGPRLRAGVRRVVSADRVVSGAALLHAVLLLLGVLYRVLDVLRGRRGVLYLLGLLDFLRLGAQVRGLGDRRGVHRENARECQCCQREYSGPMLDNSREKGLNGDPHILDNRRCVSTAETRDRRRRRSLERLPHCPQSGTPTAIRLASEDTTFVRWRTRYAAISINYF